MMTKEAVILHNWSVVATGGSYTAPECRSFCLQGEVFGHSRFPEGSSIVTSRIVGVSGRVIKTHSGSKYCLGRIDLGYRKFLRGIRPDWNWRKPITFIKA